jgi:antitoxin HigA-1
MKFMTIRTNPPAPGHLIRQQVLKKFSLRQADLAAAMGVSKVRLNLIINGKAPVTTEMALRLAKVTGTEAEYWLRLQLDHQLHRARARLGAEIDRLAVITNTGPLPEAPALPGVECRWAASTSESRRDCDPGAV